MNIAEEDELTFSDGVLLCKHIYQCAIHKTLHGVMEEWEIFEKTHEMLSKLDQKNVVELSSRLGNRNENIRLDELLFKFNLDSIYATI